MQALGLEQRNLRTGIIAALGALAMLGLGFAAVPLYRIFCQVTGFGGTTMRATEEQASLAERIGRSAGAPTISIRFDASIDRGMPWTFRAKQVADKVQVGERDIAFYEARNNSSLPVTGTATFNVMPVQAGKYFNKIQCFCFTEQTLQPGQRVDMPVLYYIDPAALDDPLMKGVEQITLSYTFHVAKTAT